MLSKGRITEVAFEKGTDCTYHHVWHFLKSAFKEYDISEQLFCSSLVRNLWNLHQRCGQVIEVNKLRKGGYKIKKDFFRCQELFNYVKPEKEIAV